MTLAEQIAHLKGLAEGMDIQSENSKEAKLLTAMLDVISSIGKRLEELDEDLELVNDGLDGMEQELMDLEEDVYYSDEDDDDWSIYGEDDDEDDDLDDEEPANYVVKCPSCGAELYVDEDTLLAGKIRCNECGQLFSLEIVEDSEDEDKDDYYDEEEDEDDNQPQ